MSVSENTMNLRQVLREQGVPVTVVSLFTSYNCPQVREVTNGSGNNYTICYIAGCECDGSDDECIIPEEWKAMVKALPGAMIAPIDACQSCLTEWCDEGHCAKKDKIVGYTVMLKGSEG